MNVPNQFPCLPLLFFALILNLNVVHAQTTSLAAMPAMVYSNDNETIVDMDATANHQLFFEALERAELDCLLNESEGYTVFAPSDAAFSKIPPVKMKSLLSAEDKMQLKALLRYHIIKGRLSASKILKALCRGGGRTTLTTIHGTKIRVSFKGNDIMLTDNMGNAAKITMADLEQFNGVVHQIDRVILPSRI